MALFYAIDDGEVLLLTRGVYRQTKLFKRVGKEEFYAAQGTGFIKLHTRPHTSASGVSWLEAYSKTIVIDERGNILNK